VAVHVPTDPDTERLLQNVFTATVRHVAALHELLSDLFTALEQGEEERAASSASRGREPVLLSPATLRVEDLRAVFSVLVVLVQGGYQYVVAAW
jgi:hypothetical protein